MSSCVWWEAATNKRLLLGSLGVGKLSHVSPVVVGVSKGSVGGEGCHKVCQEWMVVKRCTEDEKDFKRFIGSWESVTRFTEDRKSVTRLLRAGKLFKMFT